MTSRDADDAAVSYEQARRLRTTMLSAGMDRGHLWLYYFSIGGEVSEFEVDAYLHHSLTLPRLQRDLLAQAANEILANMAPPRAPLSTDMDADSDSMDSENATIQDSNVMDHEEHGRPDSDQE